MPSYLETAKWGRLYAPAAALEPEDAIGILEGVEADVAAELGYDPVFASFTLYLTTDGTDRVYVPRRSLVSVTGVWENRTGRSGQNPDSAFGDDNLLTAGTNYYLETGTGGYTGALIRVGTVWPLEYARHPGRLANHRTPAVGAVKVTGTAGWTAGSPAGVISACYAECSARLRAMAGTLVMSESVDGVSVSTQFPPNLLNGPSAPFYNPQLKGILQKYKFTPLG